MTIKNVFMSVILLLASQPTINAQGISSFSWYDICKGNADIDWYGSPEACYVADIVLEVQKNSGGWEKNIQIHKLTDAEKAEQIARRDKQSCLDNATTTQEMNFLAMVYNRTKEKKYLDGFMRGLNMLFEAEKKNGGWSQYWPLTGNGHFQDDITFNDNLMLHVVNMMRDIYVNSGEYHDIVDADTRDKCHKAYERGIQTILKCQIDDNGVKSGWCAQHDPETFLPTGGRTNEPPSISCLETSRLLVLLMRDDTPNEELKEAVRSAIKWLQAHKMQDKALEEYTNTDGEKDLRIIDKKGSDLWARCIQLGGKTAEVVYNTYFERLRKNGKDREYEYEGKTYTYNDYTNATSSYDAKMAYKPIYAFNGKKDMPIVRCRFIYNYETTKAVKDKNGVPIPVSIPTAKQRTSYKYLGNWCQNVIEVQYPRWEKRIAEPTSKKKK